MKVTALRQQDRSRWAELWTGLLDYHKTTRPPEQYDYTWTRLHDGRLHGLAARDADERMIGLVHYLFHEHCWMMEPICYLQDLFVDPAVRGTGAGRALIEAVAEATRAAGCTRLYWSTDTGNAAARRLYDRMARQTAVRYDLSV